jgi:hypothetical protein
MRFISAMHVASRPSGLISSSAPLSQSRSRSKDGSAREVVVERKWSWSSVTESEEFVGRMSFVSRLPQYLRAREGQHRRGRGRGTGGRT